MFWLAEICLERTMQHQTAVLFEEILLQSAIEEVLCTTQQWMHHIHSLCQHMPTCLIKKILVLADLASSLAQTGTGIKQSSCKHLALCIYEFCFASTFVISSWLNSMAMCDTSQNFCVRCENSKKFSRDHRSMSWASWLSWTPKWERNSFDLCRLATLWKFEIGDHLLMLLWQLSFLSPKFVGLPWAKSWLGHDPIWEKSLICRYDTCRRWWSRL